jgi:hypothetical protein
VLVTLGCSAFTTPSLAATPVGDQVQVSQAGTDGDASRRAANPASAYNPASGLALVVWAADDVVNEKYEIYGRLVSADGVPQGGEFRIGSVGPAGDAAWDATDPRVAYNSRRNEFLVVWSGNESAVAGDVEIRGQRVAASGVLLGASRRISDMGIGDNPFRASLPQLAYNSTRDEYVVVWYGIDNALPGRVEVWARRVAGATGAPLGLDTKISALRNAASHPTIAYNSVANEYLVAFIGKNSATSVNSQRVFVQRLTADVALVLGNRQIFQAGETHKPAIVYNPVLNEYLVAMPAIVAGETEAYAQRLNALGVEIGTNDQRISHMGPDGAPDYGLLVDIAVGYSPRGEYLVTWSGDTTLFGLLRDENEIFGQGLDNTGAEYGPDDFPISSMGPDGSAQFGVGSQQFTGPLAYAPDRDRFFVVWNGDNGPPLADNEIEAYGRMVASSVPAAAPPPPPPPPPVAAGPRLMPDFVPLFATRQRGSRGVRGYLYGISGLKTLPYGTVVSMRCERACKMKQASFVVRTRGKHKKTSLTLRKRIAVTQNTRIRVTARHEGYVSRWIRYAFVRKRIGIVARRVGSGCQTYSKPVRTTRCAGR